MALIAGLVVVPSTASANHDPTLSIEVGHGFFESGTPAASMRFLSPNLTVHRGTTLNFLPGGLSTATALPAGTDVDDWIQTNTGLGGPYAFNVSDADDGGLAVFKYNNNVVFPSGSCTPASPTCTYNGTDVANSGVLVFGPPSGANMVIDAPAGSVFWIIDVIHTNMRMKVTVVGNNVTPTTTQADIDTFAASVLARDLEAASALHTKLLTRRSSHVAADGTRVWDVHAGFDTEHLALFDFYPSRSVVKRGQRVRFHFDNLQHEIHTVTFPRSFALEIASQDFDFQCDPDGPNGSAPNTPASFDPATGPSCPTGTTLEIQVAPGLLPDVGDGRVTGASDREHSGPRGAYLPSPPTHGRDAYTLQFTKVSSKRGYSFDCAIHPGMRGTVVTRRG